MMFENNLSDQPTLRSQLLLHLPLAAIVLGVLAAFMALHLAITGVIIAAVAHIMLGLVLLGIRRHRSDGHTHGLRRSGANSSGAA